MSTFLNWIKALPPPTSLIWVTWRPEKKLTISFNPVSLQRDQPKIEFSGFKNQISAISRSFWHIGQLDIDITWCWRCHCPVALSSHLSRDIWSVDDFVNCILHLTWWWFGYFNPLWLWIRRCGMKLLTISLQCFLEVWKRVENLCFKKIFKKIPLDRAYHFPHLW